MAFEAPKLDDRRYQDIVDEAKQRIPHYCKEWTDHNVSDPGVTLIELFAWMTDMMLYRLNQLPRRHVIKFMEMLGIRLGEPQPARVPVTFWLTEPQPIAVTIPTGTEVASTQTESVRSIVFTSDEDLCIVPPQLAAVLSQIASVDGDRLQIVPHDLRSLNDTVDKSDFAIFSAKPPQPDDALYFGFENDLSRHILDLALDFDPISGAGHNPRRPPYVWEAATAEPTGVWQPCVVEMDTTRGMNAAGRIRLHLPPMVKTSIQRQGLFSVRVRVIQISASQLTENMRPYKESPRMRSIQSTSWGGTVWATHAQSISNEQLGYSDGSPGQQFQLQATPILERQPAETLMVLPSGMPPQAWHEVLDFADSESDDRNFTLDSVTGELRLGPALRQQDGTIKLFGAIPPKGARLIFRKYRIGGGAEGNVGAGYLNTLKSAIPFVARCENRKPASGGFDAETLEAAIARTPAHLRSRDRAVTEDDFEFLAKQAWPARIGRAKCWQVRPDQAGKGDSGRVYVLLIPRVVEPGGHLQNEQLHLEESAVERVRQYLDERRLLTTRAFTWRRRDTGGWRCVCSWAPVRHRLRT